MSDISQSTTEQAHSLSDVNNEVTRLSALTQENVTMVDESASASQKLSNAAVELSAIVRRFKITPLSANYGSRHNLIRSA